MNKRKPITESYLLKRGFFKREVNTNPEYIKVEYVLSVEAKLDLILRYEDCTNPFEENVSPEVYFYDRVNILYDLEYEDQLESLFICLTGKELILNDWPKRLEQANDKG